MGQWTPEQDAILLRMKRNGVDYASISSTLDRTMGAVKARFSFLSQTPERRHWHYARRKERDAAKRGIPRINRAEGSETVIVPPEVLEARDKCLREAKSLTGWICGDPSFSRSALAQKLGVSA